MFIIIFLISQMFYGIARRNDLFIKKERNLALANLGFLIISLCIALALYL